MDDMARTVAELQELGKQMAAARDPVELQRLGERVRELGAVLLAAVPAPTPPARVELDAAQVEEVLRQTGETLGFVELAPGLAALSRDELTTLALERARAMAEERRLRTQRRRRDT